MKCNTDFYVSFYDSLKETGSNKTLKIEDLFHEIKTGKWKGLILDVKSNLTLKKTLPCFTPTGTFSYRNSEGISIYSGLICLDIDNVENLTSIIPILKTTKWIWAIFTSPSGKGLKIFVLTQSIITNYKKLEEEIALAFHSLTGLMRDERAKDISRVHFISYDPDLYINPEPIYFENAGV